MDKLLQNHPCFNHDAKKKYGRLHLPVAASCNVQCNFCNRKYDCPNESRPGVTSALLSPKEALLYTKEAVRRMGEISVIGIAGPGEPFADSKITLETLLLVRSEFPDILLCTASNGLNVAPYVKELKELGVSHVTITVNAVYPTIGAHVYSWVRKGKKVMRGIEGAEELLKCQEQAITLLAEAGIVVKINSIVMPGINMDHMADIASWAKARGASIMNCIPIYPVKDAIFENMEPPSKAAMEEILSEVGDILPLMKHCARCRADAAGLIGCDLTQEREEALGAVSMYTQSTKPYVAVASREGALINLHMGEAKAFYIYTYDDASQIQQVELREAPDCGQGDARWQKLLEILSDCRAVLVSDVGERPKRILEQGGIKVYAAEGMIEDTVDAILKGKPIKNPVTTLKECGHNCEGNGLGCG